MGAMRLLVEEAEWAERCLPATTVNVVTKHIMSRRSKEYVRFIG